jgi:hypothetical protein
MSKARIVITKEISDALRAALPAMTSDALQVRLKEADELEDKYERLHKNHIELRQAHSEVRDELTKSLERSTSVEATAKSTEERMRLVALRESEMKLNEFKVEAADEKVRAVMAVTAQVFANRQYKYTETTQVPLVIHGIPVNQYQTYHQTGHTTTEEQKKTVEGEVRHAATNKT